MNPMTQCNHHINILICLFVTIYLSFLRVTLSVRYKHINKVLARKTERDFLDILGVEKRGRKVYGSCTRLYGLSELNNFH